MDLKPVIATLLARRVPILRATLVAAVLTLGIAFLLPRWYRATAVLMPPEELTCSRTWRSRSALTKFPAFGVLDDYFSTPADTYKAILTSRTVQEEHRREVRPREALQAQEPREDGEGAEGPREGEASKMTARSRSPSRTATNSARPTWRTRTSRSWTASTCSRNSRAKQTRVFLEGRVAETDSLLRLSEHQLQRYQEAHGAVAPTNAEAADAGAAADLMARRSCSRCASAC